MPPIGSLASIHSSEPDGALPRSDRGEAAASASYAYARAIGSSVIGSLSHGL